MSKKNKLNIKIYLIYIPLIVWTFITIFPFLYMLLLSTKGRSEIFHFPPPLFFDKNSIINIINNYKNLLGETFFWSNFRISLYTSLLSSLFAMFFCSLAGFGFAMYEFKGKKFLYNFMIFTMMIPAVVSIVPYFAQMKVFGWLNMPRALYLPVVVNAYGVFLMKQFIEISMPKSLLEAARIDGASEFMIYYKITLPILKPALGTLGIISFLTSWNDFMRSLVIMTEKSNYTIPVALNTMKGMQTVDYGAIMIGSTISILPLVIVFAFMSKWIISRLTEGAIKG